MILKGDEEEYLVYFPEDTPIFAPYLAARAKMLAEVERLKVHLSVSDRKEFAALVKDSPVSQIMFCLHKGQTYEEAIQGILPKGQVKLLEKYL